ncbi:hypothetical protein FOZ63_006938, partial [Perkinsus olseni]
TPKRSGKHKLEIVKLYLSKINFAEPENQKERQLEEQKDSLGCELSRFKIDRDRKRRPGQQTPAGAGKALPVFRRPSKNLRFATEPITAEPGKGEITTMMAGPPPSTVYGLTGRPSDEGTTILAEKGPKSLDRPVSFREGPRNQRREALIQEVQVLDPVTNNPNQ